MNQRNLHFDNLQSNYLFSEITKRKQAFVEKFGPEGLISLGIGDTTEPIPDSVAEKMQNYAAGLSTRDGYHGYGPYKGREDLREMIAEKFYDGRISADEVFLSDGSKPDIGRLQFLFSPEAVVAVQDPSYPVYVDASVIAGRSGRWNVERKCYEKIVYMACRPENDFFPDLSRLPHVDLIYFCAPNNPTGAMPNYEQLQQLVDFSIKNGAVIIYDSAYACFVRSKNVPKTIFEIDGAQEVAIETSSFSKVVGFTGVRLGWTIVPASCRYADGTKIKPYWERILSTIFNGASNISQEGGTAALTDEGLSSTAFLVDFYMKNIELLRSSLEGAGYSCHGGVDAPYLWVYWKGMSSWQAFEDLLHKKKIVATPGVGFGPAGEGFLRLTGFGHRQQVEEAAKRLAGAIDKSPR